MVASVTLQFWDRVCGTSDVYDKHVAAFPTLADFQRHIAAGKSTD